MHFVVLFIILFFNACSPVEGKLESSIKCDVILDKNYYEICYDYKYKGALFVSYSLNGKKIYENNIGERDKFYIEDYIQQKYRSSPDDYIGSGYDKGHLASDASFDYTLDALHSVYSMANIVPQYPEVNRELWIDTEYYERQKAREFGSVDVMIGVVYSENPMQIGENTISVPSAFYKAIVNKEKSFKECYYYENIPSPKDESLEEHRVECEELSLEYY